MSKQTVIDAINESNKIAILPHLMADGDAWGSSLALFFALRHIEKEVKLISEEEIPEYYKFLPGNELAVNEWKKRRMGSGYCCRLW
jgi:phosphoesterase RecJ-like protein